MKKIILFTISIIITQGCAFDQKEEVRKIIGRFALHKTFNPENVSLEYHYAENGSAGLVDGCELVKFDSASKIIYVKQGLNHFVFELNDYKSANSKLAYKKLKVEEREFKRRINFCKHCVIYYPSNDF